LTEGESWILLLAEELAPSPSLIPSDPVEVCPIPDYLLSMFNATEPEVVSLLEGPLLNHRDFIYSEYLGFPVEM
jgi:hypothetical protein